MKKSIVCLLLILILAAGLVFNTSAADTPDLKISGTAPAEGVSTITVEFTNIPENNPVEYAQILLTCRTASHNIVNKSLSFNGSTDDMQMTHTFNTSADNLLLLLEPVRSDCAGMGNGKVYTFSVKHTGDKAEDIGFDLAAVLILKDGTEYELNQRITAEGSNAPSNPTDPTTQPPTTVPVTTPPTNPSSTTPTGNSGNNGSNFLDTNTMLIVLCVALAAMFASICAFIAVRNQKKP